MNVTDTKTVSIFLPSLYGGGAERVMVSLANSFSERGYRVDLVLATAAGPFLQEVRQEVQIIDLKSRRVICSLPRLVRYLRRARPEAMLSAMGHANVVAVVAKMLARVPTRMIVSQRNHLSAVNSIMKSSADRILLQLMKWAYRRADGIIAVSFGVGDDLSKILNIHKDRVSVVYNPVITAEMCRRSEMSVDHPWFAPDQPPVILGVGRLEVQKDFSTLIKSFALLRQTRHCRLLLLGEGKLRNALEDEARRLGVMEDVCLAGFVDNPFPYMRRASLFVLSSAFEGLPNALIQAMACGSPVVSTNCPSGPMEILEGGKWGRLVPVGDFGRLAEAMNLTLEESTHPDVACRAQVFREKTAEEGYLKVLFPK